MKKLKECPFCGEKNQKVSQYESGGAKVFVVQCEYCGGLSGYAESEQSAIHNWNNREEVCSCPFCGGKASLRESTDKHGKCFLVVCNSCGASGGAYDDEAGALDAWKERI